MRTLDTTWVLGREVHVTMDAHAITTFVEHHKPGVVCFRCGEKGHVRNQCLTFKTTLCWNGSSDKCSDPFCTFAHGNDELRSPRQPRCVRVVKQAGNLICIGCNSTTHTFRRCPHQQHDVLL
jgi:hypothetical protein